MKLCLCLFGHRSKFQVVMVLRIKHQEFFILALGVCELLNYTLTFLHTRRKSTVRDVGPTSETFRTR